MDVVVFVKDILSLPTPFYYVCVSVSMFIMALSTVFHSINSPDNSLAFSLCSSGLNYAVLPVLILPYSSF